MCKVLYIWLQISLLESDWRYPYHLNMRSGVLKTENLNPSKYGHIFGHYKHGQNPTRCLPNINREHETKPRNKIPIPTEKYRSKRDCNCKDCTFEVGKSPHGEFKPFKQSEVTCRISIPKTRHYSLVRQTLEVQNKHVKSSKQYDQQHARDIDLDLKSWIFTPTHQRSRSGNLNFTHNMVDCNDKFTSYIHILVVQRSQYILNNGDRVLL